MRTSALTSLSVLLVATACGRAPDAGEHTAPLREPTTPELAAPIGGDAPEATAPEATSPTAPAALPAAVAQLAPESRAALAAAPVAMLVLPAEYAAGSTVMTGEAWAALSYRDDALTISLHATSRAHPVIDDDEVLEVPPPEHTVRGEPARVTINEAIRSVAWQEGGVAYALEVECARPMDDVRCTESEFVLALADELVPAGATR
jgi:hypothetical protein